MERLNQFIWLIETVLHKHFLIKNTLKIYLKHHNLEFTTIIFLCIISSRCVQCICIFTEEYWGGGRWGGGGLWYFEH